MVIIPTPAACRAFPIRMALLSFRTRLTALSSDSMRFSVYSLTTGAGNHTLVLEEMEGVRTASETALARWGSAWSRFLAAFHRWQRKSYLEFGDQIVVKTAPRNNQIDFSERLREGSRSLSRRRPS